ncbi:MAG TPA: VOC family protein, partial [Kofleriaceae bacterium]
MKPTPKGWPRISQATFYPDAAKAIDFLRDAFGFEVRLVVNGEGGGVEHSELTVPGGVVMVADSGRQSKPSHRAPAELGGNTQNMFIYVDDIEAHCQRARAAGAEITKEPTVSDYGEDYWADRGYECVDPGGHRWWFAQRTHTGAGFKPKLDASDVATSQPPPKGWPRISSSLYYTDPSAAIDWLCQAFGFDVQLKVEGEGGRIEHSELVFGGGLVMVGDVGRERWPDRREPSQVGGGN